MQLIICGFLLDFFTTHIPELLFFKQGSSMHTRHAKFFTQSLGRISLLKKYFNVFALIKTNKYCEIFV